MKSPYKFVFGVGINDLDRQVTTDGKLFELSQSRSGSYYSDYHYEDVDELYEVRKVPITTYKYEAV